jgi:hypothetical protein
VLYRAGQRPAVLVLHPIATWASQKLAVERRGLSTTSCNRPTGAPAGLGIRSSAACCLGRGSKRDDRCPATAGDHPITMSRAAAPLARSDRGLAARTLVQMEMRRTASPFLPSPGHRRSTTAAEGPVKCLHVAIASTARIQRPLLVRAQNDDQGHLTNRKVDRS